MKTRIGALLVLAGVEWGCGTGPTGIPLQDPPATPAVTVAVTPRPTTTPYAIQPTPTPCRPQKYCHGR